MNPCAVVLMSNPQYPSPGPKDTSSSIAELKNLHFDQLRKGFPRNPILNINQSLDRLPSRLASRLTAPPSSGNIITTSRVEATAQFTTIRSVDLIGEDFEMETCAGATGAHDAETDPTTGWGYRGIDSRSGESTIELG